MEMMTKEQDEVKMHSGTGFLEKEIKNFYDYIKRKNRIYC